MSTTDDKGNWFKGVMPNDALDPNSYVGRKLNANPVRPEPVADAAGCTEISGDATGEALPPVSNEPRWSGPLPLWQTMTCASGQLLDSTFGEATAAQCWAAEIEALRDWLLPEEPEPQPEDGRYETWTRWHERQRLRAILAIATELEAAS